MQNQNLGLNGDEPLVTSPPEKRNPWGWALLIAMLVLQLFASSMSTLTKSQERLIDGWIDFQKSTTSLGVYKADPKHQKIAFLHAKLGLYAVLRRLPQRGAEAALLRTATRIELGLPADANDLVTIRKSPKSGYVAAAQLFSPNVTTPAQVRAHAKLLPTDFPHGKSLVAVALCARGDCADLIQRTRVTAVFNEITTQGSLLVVAMGIVAVVCFIAFRNDPLLKPKGFSVPVSSNARADRYALQAAGLFVAFNLAGILAGGAVSNAVKSPFTQLFQGLVLFGVMLYCMAWLFNRRLAGSVVSRKDAGIVADGFGMKLFLGAAAATVAVPAAIGLIMATEKLFGASGRTHPDVAKVLDHRDWGSVASMMILACVIAPIWEETAFRGLLFPALSRVFKSVPVGALISSLLFALLHPEGLAAAPALTFFALASCALYWRTASTIPSIVMHSLYNGVLLAAVLFR